MKGAAFGDCFAIIANLSRSPFSHNFNVVSNAFQKPSMSGTLRSPRQIPYSIPNLGRIIVFGTLLPLPCRV